MNWGYRVAILYISFAGLIIFLVTKSFRVDVDLVAPDYYAQEVKYNGKMESIERNNNLSTPTMIYCDNEGIRVEFPSDFETSGITGSINIFRPSDKSLDFTIDIAPVEGNLQIIPPSDLAKGMYRVKVDYQYENESYYTEKQVVVR